MNTNAPVYPPIFPSEVSRDIHIEVLRRVDSALRSDEDRDRHIEELADQLDGLPRAVSDSLGSSACDLEDPLSAEHFYDVLSNVIPGWERAQLCMVDPMNPDDAELSREVEQWLNKKAIASGLRDALYNAFFYANAGLFGVIRLVWSDETIRRPGMDDDTMMYSGIRFVTPHPADVHLYPAASKSVDKALCCIEKVRLTREELLEGIRSMGLHEESVQQCIKAPPSDAGTDIQSDDGGDTPYECFYVLGRVPLLTGPEGKLRTPDDLLGRDYEWLVCPDRNVVLMCREYRYPVRPWVFTNAITLPDSYIGTSTVRLLTSLQDQATGLLRAYMDSVNISAVPAMVVPERLARRFGSQKLFPGAHLLVEHASDEIKPLVWDMRGLAAMEVAWGNIASRAAGLASAQGRPSMGAGKVRKATEVAAMEQQVSAKFDLIFTCVRKSIEDVFRIMTVMYAVEADLLVEDPIPSEALWRPWRFTATATTESANPRLRAERTARKNAIQNEYLTSVLQLPPEYHRLKYHAAASMLMDEGERQPELWLGPEPLPYDEAVVNSIINDMQNGGMPGDGGDEGPQSGMGGRGAQQAMAGGGVPVSQGGGGHMRGQAGVRPM